ncbi:hypothetical protein PHYC_03331 [Phycisphaerales bacterium]|nr:hypothetical protein PHYC_03331 [Phycisphaerales bacterium]
MLTRLSLTALLMWLVVAAFAPSVAMAQHRFGNRFAGDWAGALSAGEDAGRMRLEVSGRGGVEGTILDRTGGKLLDVDGNVTFRGVFTGTLTPTRETAIRVTGLFEPASGGIRVRFSSVDPPGDVLFQAFLRHESNNQRPAQRFAGEYRGDFDGPAPSGSVRLEIEGDGDMEGTFTHPTIAAFSGEFEGRVAISGDFMISIRNGTTTTLAVGRLSRHGNDLSATFTSSLAGVATTMSFSARRLHGDDHENNGGNGNGSNGGNGHGGGNSGGQGHGGGPVVIVGSWSGTARVAAESEPMTIVVSGDGSVQGAVGDGSDRLDVTAVINARGGIIGTMSTDAGSVSIFRGAARVRDGRLTGVVVRTIGLRRFQNITFALAPSTSSTP